MKKIEITIDDLKEILILFDPDECEAKSIDLHSFCDLTFRLYYQEKPKEITFPSKWIDIKVEEPKEDLHVLLYDRHEGICVGYRSYLGGYNHHPLGDFAKGAPLFEVTHWMDLPNIPN